MVGVTVVNAQHLSQLHRIHIELHDILFKKAKDEDAVIVLLQEYYNAGFDINTQIIDNICQGSTLLMVAAYTRCIKVVDWLLHHHADINLRHLTHVGYNAFSILATPTITNKLATSFQQRESQVESTLIPNQFVHTNENSEVALIYLLLHSLASRAVAVQPACAFSLFSFICLTDLTVMPPVNLVNLVLEQISISSSHFFVLIDTIEFFVQAQAKFPQSDCAQQFEEQHKQIILSNVPNQPQSTKNAAHNLFPSTYIAVNTCENRQQAMNNFMHLFDILIYHLEKMPCKQQMITNEHYKYKPIYRLLQDCNIQHTQYPQGTQPKDATFVLPPHDRVKPLRDGEIGNIRYKNNSLLKEGELPPAQTDSFQLTGTTGSQSTGASQTSDEGLVGEHGSTLVSNTVLPSAIDSSRVVSALEQGEDRLRVKAPRNYYLPIFFLLRAAQPHFSIVLFYIQRHYYGFMQEYVEHKFRQLEIVPKANKMSLVDFFSFLNRDPTLPHQDVPHDLEAFDQSLEELQQRIAEREQIQGTVGRLQMKLSASTKQEPRIVDSYANYLLFKQVLKYSYPYTPTTMSILELLFTIYDITGNTYLSCCREKRQQKQRDQQLKKSDLKGYHSPDCQYFEYYCELLLTFTQYGRYRNKSAFSDELLQTIGPIAKIDSIITPAQMVQQYTKVQHDTAFLTIHGLLNKYLTELTVLARRARLAPHIYSNLFIYGQHQTSTIRYVLDELKGEDRYHLQAQDLANLDYNIMSYIGNLGNNSDNSTTKDNYEIYPSTDRELIDVVTNALSYFFDFEANFFLTQADALQAARSAEENSNRPVIIKTYTIDGGDVTHPIINPNGCYWRFTRVKDCVTYLNSIEYFWHHMIRLVYHLMNNNAMNPEMVSAILTQVLSHGLTYRPKQIRTILLSLVYNIPGYFQGQNAPSYPLISAAIIKNLPSGNAVAAPAVKPSQHTNLTTTRTATDSTTRSTKLNVDEGSDDESPEDDKYSDYHYTTAAIGNSNAIISSVEQDTLKQVRFLIVNMSDHPTIIRNVLAFFAFLKSLHVKSADVVQRENKELKEIRKRRRQQAKDDEEDEEEDGEEHTLMADYFPGLDDDDDDTNTEQSTSASASNIKKRKNGEVLNDQAGTTYKNAVVLRRECPDGGERFFIRFSELELSFVNKFFNIPSSFECIPMFYRIYRELLTLYWAPQDEEDEDWVDEQRAKDKSFDHLPVPPPLSISMDPRIIDKNSTIVLTTPTRIETLSRKSIIPGNRALPTALHCLFPTSGSRNPLTLKCFEIELASYIVKYRDYQQYDPFAFIKDETYKIIINHLQQFQMNQYYCYSELVVNVSMMYFLAMGRMNWQDGKYDSIMNKNDQQLNNRLDPSDYTFYPFDDLIKSDKASIEAETPWTHKVEITKYHISALEVFKEELLKYIIFYCTDNKRRMQTMTSVLSRLEQHIIDKEKPSKKTKYKHYIHSLFFPIQQPNHPWFPLTNSLLDPYMGFYTIVDNVHFNVQGQHQKTQNHGNTPYQHYSRQIRPDYIHVKTYAEFFEATTYDVNNIHNQYFHYSQQNPFHHDKGSSLRYMFQYNRDYTFALIEMFQFYHTIQSTSVFAKFGLGKTQLTSYVCKPYQRMYLTKVLTTYKDFVQRDNTMYPQDAQKYIINYKYLVDIDRLSPQRAEFRQQVDFLIQNEPANFIIGKDNKFNFDMYTRLVRESDYGSLIIERTADQKKRLVLPEKITSYNKKKMIETLKQPPHASLHGSTKEKATKIIQSAGEGACYAENPLFTLREQDLIYHQMFQQVINYFSIGEFKHLAQIDIDVVTLYIQQIQAQRKEGISFKQPFLNLGHNYTAFAFDFTRILNSQINPYTIKMFKMLFQNDIINFQQRVVSVDLPPACFTNSTLQLPGQITLDELTHRRQQSYSTALYTQQRIPTFNHNLQHIDQPHHNLFNLLISHQFAYDPILHEPIYQLKLPSHSIDYDSFTMYDHKFSNCMLCALSYVDNLSSTQATRLFTALQSYMRQLSPVLQRNITTQHSGSQSTQIFHYNQQQPFINFLTTRQSALVFDLLEMFFEQSVKAKYDCNIKHIIFNMLHKQTVVFNQLNVQVLSYLLEKNQRINKQYVNSIKYEVELLLVTQHLFFNPAQVHTTLFYKLFDLFFKKQHYRRVASIVHLNQLSRLCVITDVLYHFRLPVYSHKRIQEKLLAFDPQDTNQEHLSLHQFQQREKDHKDSRETLDKRIAITNQYLQLFNFNAPVVSQSSLTIIHDLLAMGRGFCSSCQHQSKYIQAERFEKQRKYQEGLQADLKSVTEDAKSKLIAPPQNANNFVSKTAKVSVNVGQTSREKENEAIVDTGSEVIPTSKNVCSCQPIIGAYQYFQGLVEDLIRRERFMFIQNSENHTWSPRVTVAQALYDIMFYYNMYQHNVQNTHARIFLENNPPCSKGLQTTNKDLHWISGLVDMTQGEIHNLPKRQLPETSGLTCYSFNNKHSNVVHALINHPVDKIRSIFDVTKIYPGKSVTFDVTYDLAPIPHINPNNKAINDSVKDLSTVSLYEFLCDWYQMTKPTEDLIAQIHHMLTSMNNTTVGLLPTNELYTGYDGTKGFFMYILNNVYQPSVDDIKALLPTDLSGNVLNKEGRTIFKSFINELLPESMLLNNAKQSVFSNILLRRWNKAVLTYIFQHPLIFGQGVDHPQTASFFQHSDMFNCTIADYLLSCNTFNYAFHLVRPFILRYYKQ